LLLRVGERNICDFERWVVVGSVNYLQPEFIGEAGNLFWVVVPHSSLIQDCYLLGDVNLL
jgi:hypothetical protein